MTNIFVSLELGGGVRVGSGSLPSKDKELSENLGIGG